jgi:Uncharacterized protein conserved in bacteria
MFDRTQWVLAVMSIALSVQLSQPVAAAVPVGKVVQTAQTNSSDAAETVFEEGLQLYQQGTVEAKRSAIVKYEEALKLYRSVGDRPGEASTLNNIAFVYSKLGEKQKALEYYSQSLTLSRAVSDRPGEALNLYNIGLVYAELGEKQKALEYLGPSLPLFRAVGDRYGEAGTLYNIGLVYSELGEKQKALEYYSQSLPLFRAVGGRDWEAGTLNNIGNVYYKLGEKQKALEYYSQSFPLSRATGDREQEATTLNNIGSVYSELGEKQKALEYYSQSLPLFRALGDRDGEADTLYNIGRVYSELGEKQKALEYYSQSLPLFRALGDRGGEAGTLYNIGSVYSELGEKQKALEYYSQSLTLSRAVGDRHGEAATLYKIGNVYSVWGEQQKALEYLGQSLTLRRALGDRGGEATSLTHIGSVYSELGEKQKALEYLGQSLTLRRPVGDRRGEAITLYNIGSVYLTLGEQQKALEYYNQSLPLSRATGDRVGEATILNNIGSVYSALGEKQKALEYYSQSLTLFLAVGNRGEARTLTNIGIVYSALGEQQKALEYYSQSLTLFRAVGDRAGEAVTLLSMADAKRDQNHLTEALSDLEASIKIIEDLRTKIASPELRSSYFATVQDYYEFYIDLLMQLHKTNPKSGYDTKALEASERSRARSLLELLQESNANIREGISPDLLQQEKSLQQQLDAIEKQRIETISSPNPNPTKINEIDKQRIALLEQYQQIQTEVRTASPRYAALTQPQPLTLPEIQKQILDDNTILLQYSLGRERSYLWVVTSTGLTSYELPKQVDIETAARAFRTAITSKDDKYTPQKVAEASANLGQLILQPAAAQLGNKRLLIVPDGVLHYTPFPALTISQTAGQNTNIPLIVEHEIITLPSASTLAILRQNYGDRKPPSQTLAILADPVFSPTDERVKGQLTPATTEQLESNNLGLNRSLRASDRGWPPERLPFTRQEAQTILSLVPSDSSSQKIDFDASRTTATDGSLANYQIVHFATHGIANNKNPELSGIVMSTVDDKGNLVNGFLRLTDIFNLKLAANLVVLSACQSGMGQNIKGEGMVGLTRGFMYAGAQRVAVSLWNVDDEGTSVLMQKFYQKMLQQKLAPAAALRAAQIEMMQQEKWQSPYYWAAFTLQGEWK